MKFLHRYRYLAIKERMRDWIRIRSSDFLPTETHAQHHFLVCRTEQQFHPEIYKSTKCNDIQNTSYCPRGAFCAFAHVERKSFIYININMLPAFERLLQNVFACVLLNCRLRQNTSRIVNNCEAFSLQKGIFTYLFNVAFFAACI